MKFKDIFDLYFQSAEFSALEASTTQKAYKQYINKLSIILKDIEFENYMQLGVALPNDVAIKLTYKIYAELKNEPSSYNKIYLRRILLIVWRWAENNGLVPIGLIRKLPNFRYEKPDTKAFSKEEMEIVKTLVLPIWAEPYKALALFCFYSGMRPDEAQSLSWSDIGEEFISIRFAKGRKKGEVARLCRLTGSIKTCLPNSHKKEGLVFKSLRGVKLNSTTRCRANKVICARLGVKATFYSTRRGCATEMKKAGYEVRAISKQLGHTNVKTTEIYLKMSMKDEASNFNGF